MKLSRAVEVFENMYLCEKEDATDHCRDAFDRPKCGSCSLYVTPAEQEEAADEIYRFIKTASAFFGEKED